MTSRDQAALTARARIHAALGEPARLAIVDMLAVDDASPGQLARSLSLPTNLLAHHIRVLEQTGLVSRQRSEGDRRRTYLRLLPAALTGLIPPPVLDAVRVVFVCTHNSARSQLAAALWAQHNPMPVTSAGTHPAHRVHPRAIGVARRHGLNLATARTHQVTDIVQSGDLVIAVCDNAFEEMTATATPPDLHWSIPDPAPADTDSAFESAYADIAGRIDRLATRRQP